MEGDLFETGGLIDHLRMQVDLNVCHYGFYFMISYFRTPRTKSLYVYYM